MIPMNAFQKNWSKLSMIGKKKLLITGGLGNLGSWLTLYFSKKFDVYVLSKNNKPLNTNFILIEVDILDELSLDEKLGNIKFDYCIHTASYNEYFESSYAKNALLVNSLGTRNLISSLLKNGITKFIYFSTFHIYGAIDGNITESYEPVPRNDYASTHLFAEYYIKQFHITHNLQYIIFRLTNSYGAPKIKNFTKWYLVLNDLSRMAFINGEIVLNTNGKAKRDFIWMGDVVEIIDKTLINKNCVNETYNLGSNKTYTIIELANRIKDIYKIEFNKELKIILNDNDKTTYKELTIDSTKLLSEINYTPTEMFTQEVKDIFSILKDKNG